MSNASITPIFTTGLPRNGTTWLGNLLVERCGAVAPQHPFHFGIKESYIYEHEKIIDGRFDRDAYYRFLAQFVMSDFFLLTGLAPERYFARRYGDFFGLFFDIMDECADNANACYWTTKISHNLFFDKMVCERFFKAIEQRYSNVVFVSIGRESEGACKSYVKLRELCRGRDYGRIGRKIAAEHYYSLHQEFYSTLPKIMATFPYKFEQIEFEDLKGDPTGVVERLASRMGLALGHGRTANQFIRNSSFVRTDGKLDPEFDRSPRSWGRSLFKHVGMLTRVITQWVHRRRGGGHHPFHWRLLKYQYDKDALIAELRPFVDDEFVDKIREGTFVGVDRLAAQGDFGTDLLDGNR